MKIIATDNFDTERLSDLLIAENVGETLGKIMVEALNAKLCNHDHAPYFYKLVADDHKLFKFEP